MEGQTHELVGVAPSGVINSLQSTATLINCMCGAGLVALPFCFASCGVGLALLTMLVVCVACRFSFSLLLYCRQLSSRKTYEELAEQALGPTGRLCVRWSEAALNLGTAVAQLNILADVLSSVAGSLIPPGAEPSRNAYVTGVTVLGALPVAVIVRDPKSISALSTASVLFAFLFAVACIIMALTSPSAADPKELLVWRWEGLAVSFPVFAYAFSAHSDLLSVYADLRRPTQKRMLRVTDSAITIASTLYAVVGVAGYMQWKNRTSGDMLRNLGAADLQGIRGAYERALKACYGLSVLAMIPLMVSPFYALLLPLPSDADQGSWGPPLASWTQDFWASGWENWFNTLLGLPSVNEHGRRIKPAKSADFSPEDDPLQPSDDATTRVLLTVATLPHETTPLLLSQGSLGLSKTGSKGLPTPTTLNRRTAARPTDVNGDLLMRHSSDQFKEYPGSHPHTDEDSPQSSGQGSVVSDAAAAAVTHRSNSRVHSGVRGSAGTVGLRGAAGGVGGGGGHRHKPSKSDVMDGDGLGDSGVAGAAHRALMGGAPLSAGPFQVQRHDASSYWMFNAPSFWQHTYAVVVVLGVALVWATWVPNAEFIMGLTGSTACLLLSYVLPPATLIKLMEGCPELNDKVAPQGSVMLPADMRKAWDWRKRGAVVLLVFGVFTGIVCTAAVLGAVREEASVVYMAQTLVDVEAVAQQTAQGKAKAQQALTTVQAVEEAAARLNAAQMEANSTLDRLNQAAQSLSQFTDKGSAGGAGAQPPGQKGSGGTNTGWGLNTWVEEHKQAAQDSKTLKGVEAQLQVAKTEVSNSASLIRDIIKQLDAARDALAKEQAMADAEVANSTAAVVAAGAAAANSASTGVGGGQSAARARAAQLAAELGKAVQTYNSNSGQGAGKGGKESEPVLGLTKPLDQVRANAVATLAALQQTLSVLDKVSEVIASARKASRKDAEVRREAALAMAEALNASATSSLALSITQQVLATSASREADELIAALTKVATDLQAARSKTGAVTIIKQPTVSPVPPATIVSQPPIKHTSTPGAQTEPAPLNTAPSIGHAPPVSGTGTSQQPSTASTGGGTLQLKPAIPGATSALSTDKINAIQKAVEQLDKASGGALSGKSGRAGGGGAAAGTDAAAAVGTVATGTGGDSAGGATAGVSKVQGSTASVPADTDASMVRDKVGGSATTVPADGSSKASVSDGDVSQTKTVSVPSSDGSTTTSTSKDAASGATVPVSSPVLSAQEVLKEAVQATQAAHESVVKQIDQVTKEDPVATGQHAGGKESGGDQVYDMDAETGVIG